MSSTDMGGGSSETRPPGAAPKDMAKDAAQTVKQEAASFAADAREKAVEKIDEKKETASRTLGDFANAVRTAGDELAQSDQSMASQLVRQAADGLESFARSVADKRPEEMVEAVRSFGRRNPAAFVAGSVLAGIAIGRLLRSSASHAGSHARHGESTDFAAPGGAPPTLPIGDLEGAGATAAGSEDAVVMTEGQEELADPEAEAMAGPPGGMSGEPDRFGPRS